MKIRYMEQRDQIRIQRAGIERQNYAVNWFASAYYQDILVCLKSSWITYDGLKRILQDNYDHKEAIYRGNDIYWQKITRLTSLQVPSTTVKRPVDVILLPVAEGEIFIPSTEKEFEELKKTIKGVIRYKKRREASFCKATEYINFSNVSLPVKKDEIVAEYAVGDLRYPVTAEILDKTISIEIPKKSTCQIYITKNMSSKYDLAINEE